MTAIERLSSPRIMAGTAAEIWTAVYHDGQPAVIAPTPAPTCQIVDADTGDIVLASPTVAISAGRLTVSISPGQAPAPARWRAEWQFTIDGLGSQTLTTYHEVVGDQLFSLSEARTFDHGALSSGTAYSDWAILAMRDRIAEAFESITGVAFGLRASRYILDGDGTSSIWLPASRCHSIRAIATRTHGSKVWQPFTTQQLEAVTVSPHGRLVNEVGIWPLGIANVRVDLLHGWERVPLEIRRAALWVLRDHLSGSNLPRNAISQVDELGTFQLSTPGVRGAWFGIPEVDEILRRYSERTPGAG